MPPSVDPVRRAIAKTQNEGLSGAVKAVARRVAGPPQVPAPFEPLDEVLCWLGRQRSVSVVQIGAYVGDSENDPLYGFLSAGAVPSKVVLVEPVTSYFERLQANYAGVPGVAFENIAVADRAGAREFYRLGVDPVAYGKPEWLAQLGSLRAERTTEMWDRYARKEFWRKHRVVDTVQCDTLAAILNRHQIVDLDLLQIDAEGSDYDILRLIDFKQFRPKFINYERVLLGPDEEPCREMLRDAGYMTMDWGQDTLAVAVERQGLVARGGSGVSGNVCRVDESA